MPTRQLWPMYWRTGSGCLLVSTTFEREVITLRTRWREQGDAKAPAMGSDGVLRCGSQTAVLPPIEQRIMKVLLERFGVVVGRDALLKAGWPGQAPERNVLDVHMGRLRKRVEPVDLIIKTVRSRGYMLEARSCSSTLG
ncbi:MAG: helix-turn-helix domain-containing protein [Acidimicrobiales bacterium]